MEPRQVRPARTQGANHCLSTATASALFALALSVAAEPVRYTNATIYTADKANSVASWFEVDDGRVTAVGSGDESDSGAKTVDLDGATVVPGLIDAHGHLMGLGLALMRADLVGAETRQEVIERLIEFASDLPDGAWLLGRGWDQNDWPDKKFPTRAELDAAFPGRPVWLRRIDGHAGWANSAALAAADRALQGDWQPEGGKILRDEEGQPTGILVDRAMELVEAAVPEPGMDVLREALRRGLAKMAEVGLTGVHDAGTSLPIWQLYQEAESGGWMTARVYAMAAGDGDMLAHLCANGVIETPRLSARSVKLYADGALGSRGAAMIEPYSDDPENTGILVTAADELGEIAHRAARCGLQVNIHAIGDRGNRIVLDQFESIAELDNPGRHRVEHAQVVAVDDLPRFADLGVIASMQPTHATSDMYWAGDRVGDSRLVGAYAWDTLIESGARLALGSDFPVELPDVLHGFYAAVTRQDLKGWPEGGWRSQERLTREQTLAGFTIDAAYAAFAEDELGSLETGKHADFVVFSADIMQIPADQIPRAKVLATVVGGDVVYHAEDYSALAVD